MSSLCKPVCMLLACVFLFMAQISSAFKNFGVSSGDRCCLVAKLVDGDSDFDTNSVCASVCGRQLPVSSISEFTSNETIKKVRVSVVDSSSSSIKYH